MTNPDVVPATPFSAAGLVRSIVILIVVAIVITVTVVLPAEYGLDPTGVGRVLGLKEMGEIKVILENEAIMER